MAESMPVRVAILYWHPLLGEGLAKLLEAESGIAAAAIAADDEIGTATALASGPDVVIVERGGPADPSHIAGLRNAPILLFVGIGGPARPVGPGNGTPETNGAADGHGVAAARPIAVAPTAVALNDDLERVVRAVRDLKHERMSLVGV